MARHRYFSAILVFVLCLIATETICSTATHDARNCSESYLEALFDFKSGLLDPENLLSSWQGSNYCHWYGIGCNKTTRAITMIDLHNSNLSGEIRPSLLKLELLTYFDLSYNTFQSNQIPVFITLMKNLRYLNLSRAGFSGQIPPNFGNLSHLQYLDVSSNFGDLTLNNLQWVTTLGSLKHLEMNNVDLSMVGSEWLGTLNKLSSLTELHLSECGLTGSISSVITTFNFTSLAVIDLSFNNFNSKFPDWLVNVTSLVSVEISNCGLFGRIPLGLSELPNLRYLNLAMNYNLSASCRKLFRGSWKKVQVLDFSTNKLRGKFPTAIGNMTSLTYLGLFGNNLEGGIPSSIGRLCKLTFLDVSGNNLTGTLPEFLEGTDTCASKSYLPSLKNLRLGNNKLVGKLPEWLGQLENLEELGLEYNRLNGAIPALGRLQKLTYLGLEGNALNGNLPESFGQLSELSTFDVSFNQLAGLVSEAHFAKLSKLKVLHLSSNSLTLNVSFDWVPPFQVLFLDMGSCRLGPSFPAWLQSQKKVTRLDISNASISDTIPNWFWDLSFNLSLLNVSLNELNGQLPNPLVVAPFSDIDLSSNLFEGQIPLPNVEVELLSLANNGFSGPIPYNIGKTMPNTIFLSLSGNHISGEIPSSIGEMMLIEVIDFSNNSLTGNIPPSVINCSFLRDLDLGYNDLSGVIPESFGHLQYLRSLHLNDNKFSGKFPLTFKNLSSLETLDLANNKRVEECNTHNGD